MNNINAADTLHFVWIRAWVIGWINVNESMISAPAWCSVPGRARALSAATPHRKFITPHWRNQDLVKEFLRMFSIWTRSHHACQHCFTTKNAQILPKCTKSLSGNSGSLYKHRRSEGGGSGLGLRIHADPYPVTLPLPQLTSEHLYTQ